MSWRERWHAWREEYDADNPIAWLLGRMLGGRAKPTTLSQQAKPWIPRKRVVIFALWVGAAIVCGLQITYPSSVAHAVRTPPLINFFLMVFATMTVITSSVGAELGAIGLKAVLSPTGAFYAGMSHLRGAHVVYGVLVEQMRWGVRATLGFSAPIMVVLGVAASGSVAQGLWYALLSGLYVLALAPSLGAMGAISQLALVQGRAERSPIQWILWGFFVIVAAGLLALVSVIASGDRIVLPHNPVEWLRLAAWWLSLIPPLFIPLSLWVEFHPLWGIPQIGLVAWLSWRYVRYAATRMDEFRCLRELPQREREFRSLGQTPRRTLRAEEVPGEWG